MRKYIVLILILLYAAYSYADTRRPSAIAIEWWLRKQNKFEGAKINTKETPDGKYKITNWEANGVSQPTDDDLEAIISDYEKYQKEQEKFKKEARIRVKTKLKELGISQEDLDEVIKAKGD